MSTKLPQEAQAKCHLGEAIESPFPTLMLLQENKLLMLFGSSHHATHQETANDYAAQE